MAVVLALAGRVEPDAGAELAIVRTHRHLASLAAVESLLPELQSITTR